MYFFLFINTVCILMKDKSLALFRHRPTSEKMPGTQKG